jgi:hypothetical protein
LHSAGGGGAFAGTMTAAAYVRPEGKVEEWGARFPLLSRSGESQEYYSKNITVFTPDNSIGAACRVKIFADLFPRRNWPQVFNNDSNFLPLCLQNHLIGFSFVAG